MIFPSFFVLKLPTNWQDNICHIVWMGWWPIFAKLQMPLLNYLDFLLSLLFHNPYELNNQNSQFEKMWVTTPFCNFVEEFSWFSFRGERERERYRLKNIWFWNLCLVFFWVFGFQLHFWLNILIFLMIKGKQLTKVSRTFGQIQNVGLPDSIYKLH